MVVPDAVYPSLGTVCIAAAPLTGTAPLLSTDVPVRALLRCRL
jgi:hypothetical protein